MIHDIGICNDVGHGRKIYPTKEKLSLFKIKNFCASKAINRVTKTNHILGEISENQISDKR